MYFRTAEFHSTCPACSCTINEGEKIKPNKPLGGWTHLNCCCEICGIPDVAGCNCGYCTCGEPIEGGGGFCSNECALAELGGCFNCGVIEGCEAVDEGCRDWNQVEHV